MDEALIISARRCKNCQRVVRMEGEEAPAYCSESCFWEYHDFKSRYLPVPVWLVDQREQEAIERPDGLEVP